MIHKIKLQIANNSSFISYLILFKRIISCRKIKLYEIILIKKKKMIAIKEYGYIYYTIIFHTFAIIRKWITKFRRIARIDIW